MASKPLEVKVRHRNGDVIHKGAVDADPKDNDQLRTILVDAMHRDHWDLDRIGEFSMEVHLAGDPDILTTFTAAA